MADPITLLVCGNGAWSAHIATTLMSAKHATPNTPFRVLVGAVEIDEVDRERIQSAIPESPITWIEISMAELDSLPERRAPKFNFIEILTLNRLPPDIERVLSIDADAIVRDDLTELWNFDLAGCSFAAARDPWTPWIALSIPYFAELGLDGNQKNLQSGVKVVDMLAWRNRNIHEKAFGHLDRWHDSMIIGDQEMLNAVMGDDWIELPLRWNAVQGAIGQQLTPCAFTQVDLHDAQFNPGIIHFAGEKPWNWASPNRGSIPAVLPWLEVWEQYAFTSPYRDWYLAERERGLAARKEIRRSPMRRLKKAASVLLHG